MSYNTKSIQKLLSEQGLICEVKKYPEEIKTIADIAKNIGCKIGQIANSLLFKTKFTNIPILMIASGENQINEKEMRNRFGEKLLPADSEFMLKTTGFATKNIPPFGHSAQIDQVYLDKDLLNWESVWISSGSENSVLLISTKQLIKLSKGKVISIT